MGLVELRCQALDHQQKYHRVADDDDHYYFACLGCGRIVDVHTDCIKQACGKAAEEQGLILSHANICLEGYCPACVAKREN
jgi:Fe2+ or Zn2+ uptake regulation protein